MRTLHSPAILLLSLAIGSASAQEPAAATLHQRGDLRHNAGVAHDGDRIVGVGADYRAVFTAGSLEFTPAFGDATPMSLPLHLTLRSMQRGAHQVTFADAPVATVTGTRITFAREANVVERFDVRPEGVEHSFVFATPPAGSGDLVVRCAVRSTLEAGTEADGTVRFVREGLGGITVGHVTGIDAEGRRAAGALHLRGDALEYVLPAAFVETAVYPLVLDPLIGAQFVLGAADDLESDVAYDPGSNTHLAVWKRRYATTDHDILGQRLDAAGAPLGGTLLLETASTIVASRPCVAAVRLRSAFAVVWQQGSGPFGPFDIRARSVDGVAGAVSGAVSVVATAEDEFAPCISGDVSTVDDDVLVAWQTPTGIHAMQLTVPASLVPTPSSIVALTASPFVQKPAFSKSGGTIGQHLIVWEEESLIGDTQIRGRVVTRNLTLLTGVTSFTSTSRHKANPRCDGDGTTFLIVYERAESTAGRSDVYARRIGYAAGATSNLTGEVAVEATPSQSENAPDVAWLGTRWCLALQERQSGLDDDVVVWMLRDDCLPCSGRIQLTGLDPAAGYGREFQPRLANRFVGLQVEDRALLTFTEAQDAPPFAATTLAQMLEAAGASAPPVTIAPGCGNGGVAGSTGGPFVLGNAAFRFEVTGLPATAFPLLSLSLPGPLPPACGPCVIPSPVVLLFEPNLGGTASSPLAVPCDGALLGFAVDSQWLSLLSGSTPCVLLPDIAASSLVRFTVAD